MNHLNPWEEEIRRRLKDHRAEPPAMGWERLEAELASERQRPFWRRPVWLAVPLSAAACLALALLIGQGLEHDSVSPLVNVTAPAVPSAATERQLSEADGNPLRPSASPSQTAQYSHRETPATHRSLRVQENGDQGTKLSPSQALSLAAAPVAVAAEAASDAAHSAAPVHDETATGAKQPQEPVGGNTETKPTESSIKTDALPSNAVQRQRSISRFRMAETAVTPRRRTVTELKPALALHSSFSPSIHNRRGGYYATTAHLAASPGAEETARPGSDEMRDMAYLVSQNFNQEVSSRVRHHTPFRFGLNVSIPLSPRFALGTGLTYTRLSTDIESGSDLSYYCIDQQLHYVGVPLQASCTFFSSRPFNAYATGGVLLEKCVKGRQTTTYHVTDSYKSSTEEADDLGRGLWQLSFQLAAGMQLNLTRHVGIYFEPGVSYYVSDGSSLPSIRHDKPWQFQMEAGLRLTVR